MTVTNLPLYQLLTKFGATPDEAAAAVKFDTSALATKHDIAELKILIAESQNAIAWKVIGAMVSLTGMFALIVGWMTRGLR